MALNNRIYKYTCNVCSRSIERLANPTRPDPLRCVITDQCAGKLTLANTRFGLRPNNTPTVVGLLDRIKRGSSRVEPVATPGFDKVSLSSFAGSNGLSLALVQSTTSLTERVYYVNSEGSAKVLERTSLSTAQPTTLAVTAVLFELTPAALEYKRYTYNRIDRAIYVQGKDDSAAQGVLSFDSTSNVRVFANGVLLDSSLYDKSVSGTITFTPELENPSLLIEVFVYKSLSQFFTDDQAVRLTFTPLVPLAPERSACAWGDTALVAQYTPIFCADISALDRSKNYGLVRFEAIDENDVTITIDPTGFFMLADAPYAFQDKKLTAIVQLTSFTSEGFPLSFSIDSETGNTTAVVDGDTLAPLPRAMTISKISYVKSSQTAETVGLLASRNQKTFILGPA